MQQVKLPLTLDITRAAQKRLDFQGGYAREQLIRIAESVVSVDSDITVELSCYLDEQGLAVAKGSAELGVSLLCQRCGQPFRFPVQAQFCVSPVRDMDQHRVDQDHSDYNSMDQSAEHYDQVEVDALGKISLLGLIEDEVILSLPIVPRHQIEHCEVSETDRVFGELPEEAEKQNPFALLASLKQKHQ